jgi:hypothetical protein
VKGDDASSAMLTKFRRPLKTTKLRRRRRTTTTTTTRANKSQVKRRLGCPSQNLEDYYSTMDDTV